jgi:hypothetical protein
MTDSRINKSHNEVIERTIGSEVLAIRFTDEGFVEAKHFVQDYNTSDGSLDCSHEWIRIDIMRPLHRELKLVVK